MREKKFLESAFDIGGLIASFKHDRFERNLYEEQGDRRTCDSAADDGLARRSLSLLPCNTR